MIKHIRTFGIILALCLLIYIGRYFIVNYIEDESAEVDEWLDENDLGEYKQMFRDHGLSSLSSCGTPEDLDNLPELPAAEEKKLRRAAQQLQQRLVLRQWLVTHRLQQAYSRLINLDVSSIEDVYWLEDSVARHALEPRDFPSWSLARQSLPTTKDALQTLKIELWNAVVKNCRHPDAWTWGGMLVVSASVAGLVTLAAMTQPSLTPEAKHSLLQYVTGKYLHPASCKVEWGWTEPQVVGETMSFTVHFYQRNGNPYPICDTDELCIPITHGTRKVTTVMELGSGDPAQANTARVKFTVRTSGTYIISVIIGGAGIAGSPFRKSFAGGAVCARRSSVTRFAALLCRTEVPRAVVLKPRDSYDNPAPLALHDTDPTRGFAVKINPLGGPVDPSLSSNTWFEYDAVNERVRMMLCFAYEGVYRAAVCYDDVLLQHGEFDCIVLTSNDMATLQRNVCCKRHNITYSARLLGPAGSKPRRVLCCINPKQMIIKEYFLKIIPKKITSFRLCPSTKITLLPDEDPTDVEASPTGGEFLVEDGMQDSLRFKSNERHLIAATYAQLLADNCGGEDTFKNKQDYFYSEVRKLHSRHPHDRLSIRVSRDRLLASSLAATKHFAQADWCRNFDVSFVGEQGVDWGGVRREWFSLLCGQLFDSKFGLFKSFSDQPQGLVHPNPDRAPHLKLKHFELAGKLVGKCLYESALGGAYRQLVRARLTRSFLAMVIGLRVNYKHFEQDDPELYLSKIKYVLETDMDSETAAELFFCEDQYDPATGKLVTTHLLIPEGDTVRVSNDNKRQYLDALAQHRLSSRVRREVTAFLRGLTLLVPEHLLAIFSEAELELVVCGSAEVSAADWRRNTVVSGAGRSRVVTWLWAALAGFSAEERARLLQFCTGSSQLPAGGFQDLSPRFHIVAAPTVGALPTAHTCFNQLCLPDYDSYEQLVRALLLAITEGGEGFAMT